MDILILRDAVSWLMLLLIFGAAIVCFVNTRLSPKMPLLACGFLFDAMCVGSSRFIATLNRAQGGMDMEQLSMLYSALSLGHLVAWALIVVGLVLVFRDMQDGTGRDGGDGIPVLKSAPRRMD